MWEEKMGISRQWISCWARVKMEGGSLNRPRLAWQVALGRSLPSSRRCQGSPEAAPGLFSSVVRPPVTKLMGSGRRHEAHLALLVLRCEHTYGDFWRQPWIHQRPLKAVRFDAIFKFSKYGIQMLDPKSNIWLETGGWGWLVRQQICPSALPRRRACLHVAVLNVHGHMRARSHRPTRAGCFAWAGAAPDQAKSAQTARQLHKAISWATRRHSKGTSTRTARQDKSPIRTGLLDATCQRPTSPQHEPAFDVVWPRCLGHSQRHQRPWVPRPLKPLLHCLFITLLLEFEECGDSPLLRLRGRLTGLNLRPTILLGVSPGTAVPAHNCPVTRFDSSSTASARIFVDEVESPLPSPSPENTACASVSACQIHGSSLQQIGWFAFAEPALEAFILLGIRRDAAGKQAGVLNRLHMYVPGRICWILCPHWNTTLPDARHCCETCFVTLSAVVWRALRRSLTRAAALQLNDNECSCPRFVHLSGKTRVVHHTDVDTAFTSGRSKRKTQHERTPKTRTDHPLFAWRSVHHRSVQAATGSSGHARSKSLG